MNESCTITRTQVHVVWLIGLLWKIRACANQLLVRLVDSVVRAVVSQ